MTSNKESSYENTVSEERRRDRPVNKSVLTPSVVEDWGAWEAVNPLRSIGHLDKQTVRHPYRKSSRICNEMQAASAHMAPQMGNLIEVVLGN